MLHEIPEAHAEQVGMDQERLNHAFSLLKEAVDHKLIPGAVAIVGRHHRIVGKYSVGHAILTDSIQYETAMNTIYDCASLTKVVVTLPLVLKLVEKGLLELSDPVSKYLPEFRKGKKSSITIKHLLTHTSGLKPFVNLTFDGWRPVEIKQFIYSQTVEEGPDKRVIYSDIGFIVLGEIVSKIFDQSLDLVAKKYIFEPLGMADSQFCPPKYLQKRIAATEFREDLGRYLWGEVHDERAHALGGVSGHAGLFATAGDLARYALMWLNDGELGGTRLLSPLTVKTALENHTAALDGNRGLGWVLKGDSFDASGSLFSPLCYGHTGFTGTSIWMDPDAELFVVLLTNRVHFGRDHSITRLRKIFHNAVAASIFD